MLNTRYFFIQWFQIIHIGEELEPSWKEMGAGWTFWTVVPVGVSFDTSLLHTNKQVSTNLKVRNLKKSRLYIQYPPKVLEQGPFSYFCLYTPLSSAFILFKNVPNCTFGHKFLLSL